MKIVREPASLRDALDSARREAAGAFGDDRLLIEKYLERPRHVELQVFADSHGNAVHLFERDCSVQRRYQKILEEAPAPGLDPAMRDRMGEAAIAAVRAVAYVGAGTVEFIVADGCFYFMEMNTRIQVEHPVTEAITGLDLVEWQIRVARGEALPLAQRDIAMSGHAVEARLYAEDPARGFLPQAGRLLHLALPEGLPGVRVDSGVVQGSEIGTHYDPMIAKLVAYGPDRTTALDRLRAALAATEITGVRTNRAFLHALLSHEAVVRGAVDTGFVEREAATLSDMPADPRLRALAAFFRLCGEEREAASLGDPADPHSPWGTLPNWRQAGLDTDREIRFADDGAPLRCRPAPEGYRMALAEGERLVQGSLSAEGELDVRIDGIRVRARGVAEPGAVTIFAFGREERFPLADPLRPAADAPMPAGRLAAPMPGSVVRVAVAAGDRVARGALLVVVEAMKMEHAVTAPRDGVVARIRCAVGDRVGEGDELVVLEAEP